VRSNPAMKSWTERTKRDKNDGIPERQSKSALSMFVGGGEETEGYSRPIKKKEKSGSTRRYYLLKGRSIAEWSYIVLRARGEKAREETKSGHSGGLEKGRKQYGRRKVFA